MTCLLDSIKDWQTLWAGGLAILAALIGGGFILRQTRAIQKQAGAVERREQATLTRQHAAARAVMPLALSALVEYAQSCAESLVRVRQAALDEKIPRPVATSYVPPTLDPGVISSLADVIASADPAVGDAIAKVISNVQVLGARLRGIRDRAIRGPFDLILLTNLESYTVDAAIIFARGSALFLFARRATEEPGGDFPSEKALHDALNVMGFDVDANRRLYESASRRAEFKVD